MKRRIGVALLIGGAGLAVLPAAFGGLASALWGRNVVAILPFEDMIVQMNRDEWKKGDSVVDLYGTQRGEPMRVVFAKRDRLLVPPEDPSLTILKVSSGDFVLQAQTLRFVATRTAVVGAVVAIAGLLLRRFSPA